MYRQKICVALALIFITCFGLSLNTWAATGGAVNFSVKAILPENQVNADKTYFDLKMTPGQTQTLSIIVYNNSDTELKAHTAVISASTSRSGLINYNTPDIRDESLQTPLSEIATVQNEVLTIPAASSSEAKVTVKMPDELYDGIILGGIVITGERADTNVSEAAEGVSISNEYSYVIGINLVETDTVVYPDLHLKSISPTLANYQTALSARLQNSEAAIIKGMSVSAEVYKAGETTALSQARKESVDMAPNSTFDFLIDWQSHRIEPGDYRIHLLAKHEEKVWEWDESFTISADEANTTNQEAVGIETDAPPTWIYITGGVLILMIVLFLGFWIGRRKNKDIDKR